MPASACIRSASFMNEFARIVDLQFRIFRTRATLLHLLCALHAVRSGRAARGAHAGDSAGRKKTCPVHVRAAGVAAGGCHAYCASVADAAHGSSSGGGGGATSDALGWHGILTGPATALR